MESSRQLDTAPSAVEPDNQADDVIPDTDDVSTESPTPPAGRTLWGEPLRRLIAIALALFAVAGVIAGTVAVQVKGISPYDEATHIDYAYQVAHGKIPARGSVIAPVIRAEMVCRGPASRHVKSLPLCGQPNPPAKEFVVGAQNYNFSHPPLYYAITGVLARAAGLPLSGNHFITLARLVGVLWLFAAMLVLYLALRRFRVRWPIALCGAVMLACTPAVFYLEATVSNDAAAVLAGSLALLTLARITVDDKLGWKLPALLAFLAAATKILNALPFLAIAGILLLLAWHHRAIDKTRARRLLLIAVGIVVAVAVVYFGWAAFQSNRGDPNWVNPVAGISTRTAKGLPFDELFGTTFSGVNLLSGGYLPPEIASTWMTNMVRVLAPLSVAGVVTVLGMHRPWTVRFTVVATALVGVLSYPLIVQVQVYIASKLYFPGVTPRYGLSLVPLLIAAIMLAADDKRLTKWVVAFVAVFLGAALYTAAGAP